MTICLYLESRTCRGAVSSLTTRKGNCCFLAHTSPLLLGSPSINNVCPYCSCKTAEKCMPLVFFPTPPFNDKKVSIMNVSPLCWVLPYPVSIIIPHTQNFKYPQFNNYEIIYF